MSDWLLRPFDVAWHTRENRRDMLAALAGDDLPDDAGPFAKAVASYIARDYQQCIADAPDTLPGVALTARAASSLGMVDMERGAWTRLALSTNRVARALAKHRLAYLEDDLDGICDETAFEDAGSDRGVYLVRCNAVIALMRRERYDEAIEAGEALIDDPRTLAAVDLYCNMQHAVAASYQETGRFDDAERLTIDALRLQPRRPIRHLSNLHMLMMRRGEAGMANAAFDRALDDCDTPTQKLKIVRNHLRFGGSRRVLPYGFRLLEEGAVCPRFIHEAIGAQVATGDRPRLSDEADRRGLDDLVRAPAYHDDPEVDGFLRLWVLDWFKASDFRSALKVPGRAKYLLTRLRDAGTLHMVGTTRAATYAISRRQGRSRALRPLPPSGLSSPETSQ